MLEHFGSCDFRLIKFMVSFSIELRLDTYFCIDSSVIFHKFIKISLDKEAKDLCDAICLLDLNLVFEMSFCLFFDLSWGPHLDDSYASFIFFIRYLYSCFQLNSIG